MVAVWGGICSSDPPSIAISIRPSRCTYRNLMEKMAFTISIQSVKYMAEADFFGMVSGDTMDKFAISGLTPPPSDHVDAPCISEFPGVLECLVVKQVKIGAHTQFIGEILDVKIDESIPDSEGKPDLEKLQVISFDVFRSTYYPTGPVVGRAFSAGLKYLSG